MTAPNATPRKPGRPRKYTDAKECAIAARKRREGAGGGQVQVLLSPAGMSALSRIPKRQRSAYIERLILADAGFSPRETAG